MFTSAASKGCNSLTPVMVINIVWNLHILGDMNELGDHHIRNFLFWLRLPDCIHIKSQMEPAAVEERGLLEPFTRQGLVEEPVHPILEVQQVVEGVPAQGHGRV